MLQAKIARYEMNMTDHNFSQDLWHRCFGHISQKV